MPENTAGHNFLKILTAMPSIGSECHGFQNRLSGSMKKSLCDEGNSYHCLYRIVCLVKTVLAEKPFGKTAISRKLKNLVSFGQFMTVTHVN
jgi:hypothetical protein